MIEEKERQDTALERFVASSAGRLARTALGLGLITAGLGIARGTTGLAVAAFGLVPLATGVLNLCPIAPLWGGHFLGTEYCRRKDVKSG